jgi:hypothetical protein
MNTFGERWLTRNADYYADPNASPHDLLSDATEWLQYARHTIGVLAELIEGADVPDTHRLSIMLDGISAMTNMGLRCMALAQARVQWMQLQETMKPGANHGEAPESAMHPDQRAP